jgi:hypothetical protein
MITPFLRARHGWASAQTIHSDLYEILAPTEGVVVFHEQVIQIISIMSGASLALADEKRRALGNLHGQQEVCDWFYSSCLSRGYERAVIDKVWEVLRAFAAFGFCKAHAAAFALPTYQSAWLKRHYPAAFLAGVLTHDPGMYPKRVIIDEAKQWGISIAPLDINLSSDTYRVERCDPDTAPTPVALINTASTGKALSLPDARGYAIRLALNDLNGISDSEVAEIIAGQPYEDLIDFLHRSNVSEPITERLILVGAFDRIHSLGGDKSEINRRDLLLHLQDFYRSGSGLRKRNRAGSAQLGLGFAPPPLSSSGLPDLQTDEKVRHEVEQLGMEISHHRIEFYAPFLNAIGAVRSADLLTQRSGSSILVAGARVALQTPPVRSGNRVVFLTIDDGYGCSDITFFADAQEQCSGVLFSSSLSNPRHCAPHWSPRNFTSRNWRMGFSRCLRKMARSSKYARIMSEISSILHIDMDAFYASVAELDNPSLKGKPVVVGAGARGVVLSANYLARTFGIRAAMPVGRAKRLAPHAIFIAPEHHRYSEISERVMEIFHSFTPLVEPLSLDEAFLDVTGSLRAKGTPREIAIAIRSQVESQEGITCSVGIAPSKFIAKLASGHCKPNGLLEIAHDRILEFLHPLPVSAIWESAPRQLNHSNA